MPMPISIPKALPILYSNLHLIYISFTISFLYYRYFSPSPYLFIPSFQSPSIPSFIHSFIFHAICHPFNITYSAGYLTFTYRISLPVAFFHLYFYLFLSLAFLLTLFLFAHPIRFHFSYISLPSYLTDLHGFSRLIVRPNLFLFLPLISSDISINPFPLYLPPITRLLYPLTSLAHNFLQS